MIDLEGIHEEPTQPFPSRWIAHFRILGCLGAGGMGEVYAAEDSKLGRKVAIKVLPDALSNDAEARQRMLREARSAAALDHPNVCAIYEVGEHKRCLYIAMQYVEGDTFTSRLRLGPMRREEVLDVASQVLSALEEAHGRGIVHRDIKPLNVMVTPRAVSPVGSLCVKPEKFLRSTG